MKVYAIYRPLYGEDFIEDSINSILDYVDKVFFCYTDTPLAGVTAVNYRGQHVAFPIRPGRTMDQALERVEALRSPKIEILYQDGLDNMSQFTRLMNERILPNFERPDIAFLIEPDMVFRRSEIETALSVLPAIEAPVATTAQIELWKTPDWAIPMRNRPGVTFWNLRKVDQVPPTRRAAEPVGWDMPVLPAVSHNFGFCISPRSMLLKHLLAIAFSRPIDDSPPSEDWYDTVWLSWHPLTNNRNLEIAAGFAHLIPFAMPYRRANLPETIRARFGYEAADD